MEVSRLRRSFNSCREGTVKGFVHTPLRIRLGRRHAAVQNDRGVSRDRARWVSVFIFAMALLHTRIEGSHAQAMLIDCNNPTTGPDVIVARLEPSDDDI